MSLDLELIFTFAAGVLFVPLLLVLAVEGMLQELAHGVRMPAHKKMALGLCFIILGPFASGLLRHLADELPHLMSRLLTGQLKLPGWLQVHVTRETPDAANIQDK